MTETSPPTRDWSASPMHWYQYAIVFCPGDKIEEREGRVYVVRGASEIEVVLITAGTSND